MTEEIPKNEQDIPKTVLMALIVLLVAILFLSGCASNPTDKDAKSLIETLEFGEDECGEFQLTGEVDVGTSPLPFFKTKLHMNLDKRKQCDSLP